MAAILQIYELVPVESSRRPRLSSSKCIERCPAVRLRQEDLRGVTLDSISRERSILTLRTPYTRTAGTYLPSSIVLWEEFRCLADGRKSRSRVRERNGSQANGANGNEGTEGC